MPHTWRRVPQSKTSRSTRSPAWSETREGQDGSVHRVVQPGRVSQLGWLTRGRPARSARAGRPPRALAVRPRSGPCGRRAPVDGPRVIAAMRLRRLSNSVPSPLPSALVRPSSSRPRAVFARIRSRLRNGGSARFRRCPSRVGTALTLGGGGDAGSVEDLPELLSRAMPRSAGARAVDRVRFAVCWVGASSAPGGRR